MSNIRIYKDLPALSRAAAALLLHHSRQAAAAQRRFRLALSGGDTPRPLYELLSLPPYRDDIPWSNLDVFWSDERWVNPHSIYSNQGMAEKLLLQRVPLPRSQIHPIPYGDDIHAAADRYEELLQQFFPPVDTPSFDFLLLGLGSDGHTASLFPHAGLTADTPGWVRPVFLDDPDLNRITLTPAILNRAAVIVFLVAGSGKAPILRHLLDPETNSELPARWILPTQGGAVHWLIDEAAASLLPEDLKHSSS